jgi:hypothetical protein
MRAIMNIENLTTIESLDNFLKGNQIIAYRVLGSKLDRYQLIRKTLVKFSYMTIPKKDKGVVRGFLMKLTGYSRPQLTRLIRQYTRTGHIKWQPCRSNGFACQYTAEDIRLLAKMDERHDTPCGQAVKKLCERAHQIYDETKYQNLANISVSHLYNLRASMGYKKQRRTFEKTKSKKSDIGERRKPQPNGKPGYIRIDTVHQGDQDKQKGVYHINAVDEETQFEVLCSAEKISEQFLIPVLEQMLEKFPFEIISFHSDNGSEYINRNVAKLLKKLHVEFTKSRSRQTNDNALAESKNCSVVRKILGYQHIPQKWAPELNEFNLEIVFPYINFHRPCFFPEKFIDEKGKQRTKYPAKNMMTPFDKLKSLPNAEKHLKPGVTFEILEKVAMKMSDNEAAELLQIERKKLFNQIFGSDRYMA